MNLMEWRWKFACRARWVLTFEYFKFIMDSWSSRKYRCRQQMRQILWSCEELKSARLEINREVKSYTVVLWWSLPKPCSGFTRNDVVDKKRDVEDWRSWSFAPDCVCNQQRDAQTGQLIVGSIKGAYKTDISCNQCLNLLEGCYCSRERRKAWSQTTVGVATRGITTKRSGKHNNC